MTRKKLLIFSVALCLALSAALAGPVTFPPDPGTGKKDGQFFIDAKKALLAGDPGAAYKYLLLSRSPEEEPEWRRLYCLTLMGLGRPIEAQAFLASVDNPSPEEEKWFEQLSARQGFNRAYPRFKEDGRQATLPKEQSRKALAVASSGDSTFVLTDISLLKFDSSGALESSKPLASGKELLPTTGGVIALTPGGFVAGDRKVLFPLQIRSALSFARAPGGNYYILDGSGRVFLVSSEGSVIEERQILIKQPKRIRTDELFRVFILSGAGELFVYGASFEPLFVLSGKLEDAGAGSITDFWVDFAGDMMFCDRSGELFFFNFGGELLGKSQKNSLRSDIFWWDGGDRLLVLDKKLGALRRAAL